MGDTCTPCTIPSGLEDQGDDNRHPARHIVDSVAKVDVATEPSALLFWAQAIVAGDLRVLCPRLERSAGTDDQSSLRPLLARLLAILDTPKRPVSTKPATNRLFERQIHLASLSTNPGPHLRIDIFLLRWIDVHAANHSPRGVEHCVGEASAQPEIVSVTLKVAGWRRTS